MPSTVSVSIDVPSLARGLAFYCGAFGFSEKARPVPGVAVLHGLNVELCLLEKPAGSKPTFLLSLRDWLETGKGHPTPHDVKIHVGD